MEFIHDLPGVHSLSIMPNHFPYMVFKIQLNLVERFLSEPLRCRRFVGPPERSTLNGNVTSLELLEQCCAEIKLFLSFYRFKVLEDSAYQVVRDGSILKELREEVEEFFHIHLEVRAGIAADEEVGSRASLPDIVLGFLQLDLLACPHRVEERLLGMLTAFHPIGLMGGRIIDVLFGKINKLPSFP